MSGAEESRSTRINIRARRTLPWIRKWNRTRCGRTRRIAHSRAQRKMKSMATMRKPSAQRRVCRFRRRKHADNTRRRPDFPGCKDPVWSRKSGQRRRRCHIRPGNDAKQHAPPLEPRRSGQPVAWNHEKYPSHLRGHGRDASALPATTSTEPTSAASLRSQMR